MSKDASVKEKVREAYDKLAKESSDGGVDPRSLVEYARPENSPLHSQFEWDDEKAGQEYRVWQARQLIAKMTVEVEGVETRGYQSIVIEVEKKNERKYFTVEKIMKSENLKERVLRQIVEELERLLFKYRSYSEVFELVDKSRMDALKVRLEEQGIS